MNGFDLSTISGIFVGGNKYNAIYKGSTLIFRDYSAEYLTFESLEDNNEIGWKLSNSLGTAKTIQYSTDKTNWTNATSDTTGVTLATLNTGDKLYIKGDNEAYGNFPSNTNTWSQFTSTKTFNMYGNIMSLLSSTNFKTMTTLPAVTRSFINIFSGTKVVDASNLILPATAVTSVGYYCMFKNCTSLTGAPKLPATSLNTYAYSSMFYGCTALVTPPDLNVTTQTQYCCQYMFYGCTSLTSVPKILCTYTNNYCYEHMFENCTSLTTVPTDLLKCTTTINQGSYSAMFKGCTSLTNVPNLPATAIRYRSYRDMFYGCTSLTTVPTDLLKYTSCDGTECLYQMFYGCTSLTNVPTIPTSVPLTNNCFFAMFLGCTSLTTIPSDYLPFTTLATNCYRGMFQDCTNITTAPDLPAATLVQACYRAMFFGCSKLNYIKMLATDISATECLYAWVNSVASSGTFIKHPDMTSLPTGTSGIPTGWTVYSSDADYYKDQYLTIESLEDNNSISFKTSNSSLTPTIQYSIDKTNWTSATSTTSGVTLTILNTGDKLYLKGDNNQYSLGSSQESNISSTKTVNIYGNILSLYNSTSYNTVTSISSASNYLFRALFKGLKIIDASNLILPIANKAGCYIYLFYNCTSLTTAPALPATTLGNFCYMGMFYNCTSLTTAPALPATTLVSQCYSYMFYGCSKLNYIKMLATDISATKCLENWTSNVASSGTFVKHPNTTIPSGTSGIPSNWTVQTASS